MRQLRPARRKDSADGRTRYECDFAVPQDDRKQTTLANLIFEQVLSAIRIPCTVLRSMDASET
jgi:hypothetical protein